MGTEYLSESSVADFFDTSKTTVRRWVEKGVLPKPAVIGGLKRWPVDELRAAARRGLDAATSTPPRSADPDEIVARMVADGRKDRKADARGRHR
ncbi:helix-turn-helix transcriptional regulator [Azospirillum argentinense]|uniref:helix-turn-helix transcriptional regulator n=1 Tax=Azospirillum argentinense TaxID=2970906 RepID=UPI0009DD8B05|nr:helix-turn-helix domain-containing protein [Azospirillum argentinense]